MASLGREGAREGSIGDDLSCRNPVGLLFRYVYHERLLARLPRGARVVELGCGTGEAALLLAARGVSVRALDSAPRLLECARARAAELGLGEERVRFEERAAEDVARAGSGFDGAYSGLGALNGVDLPAVAAGLAAALRPGAPVLLSLMTARPLPALVERALTGRGEARRGLSPAYPGLRDLKRCFGAAFAWTGAFALGVVVPGPGHAAWVSRHPQAFGLLAALEGLVRSWPILRTLGDHVVLEGVRR